MMKHQISERSSHMSHSPIRSLVGCSRQAEIDGKKVFYLNIGQPDIPTPSNALAKLKSFSGNILKYGRADGRVSLREAVAGYYKTFDADVNISQIYTTTGASEAILFTLFSCFNPGDEIIIPEPFYANYLGLAHMTGVNITPVTTFLEEGFRLPDDLAFEKAINENTKAIFLCNPGNPTGQLYSREELVKLCHLVRKYNLYLIVDEVYREFCYDRKFYSVLRLREIEQHVVVIDSISKVFSACGARIGFVVTKNQDVIRAIDKLGQLRLSPPVIGQLVAEECFRGYREYIAVVKEEYNERRKVLYDRLTSIDGIVCGNPQAAFYIMAELPVDDAENFCRWLLEEFEYEGKTVMLAPGHGFYFNPELGKKQVRIAYILNVADINTAMDCLEAALETYPGTIPLNKSTAQVEF